MSNSVLRSPDYREAVRLYAKRDYKGAFTRVEGLLRVTPDRADTAEDRVFLLRQKDICQAALSGKPNTSGSAPLAPPPAPRARVASNADCGPRALLIACERLQVKDTSLPALRRAAGTNKDGTTLDGLAQAARSVGLKAEGVQMDENALARLACPAVAWMDGNHYAAVLSVRGDAATVRDPNHLQEETLPLKSLLARSGGVLLTLSR